MEDFDFMCHWWWLFTCILFRPREWSRLKDWSGTQHNMATQWQLWLKLIWDEQDKTKTNPHTTHVNANLERRINQANPLLRLDHWDFVYDIKLEVSIEIEIMLNFIIQTHTDTQNHRHRCALRLFITTWRDLWVGHGLCDRGAERQEANSGDPTPATWR